MAIVPNAVESFSEGLARLTTYAAREHDTYVPHHHQEDYFGLGKWVEDVREPDVELSNDQIKALNQVKEWTWEVQDRRTREDSQSGFEAGLALLSEYTSRHGTARPPQMVEREFQELGVWVKTMRSRFKSGELSNSQIRKILDHPGWVWDEQFARFLDHVEECRSATNANDALNSPEYRKAMTWLAKERARPQSPKRLLVLSTLPGW